MCTRELDIFSCLLPLGSWDETAMLNFCNVTTFRGPTRTLPFRSPRTPSSMWPWVHFSKRQQERSFYPYTTVVCSRKSFKLQLCIGYGSSKVLLNDIAHKKGLKLGEGDRGHSQIRPQKISQRQQLVHKGRDSTSKDIKSCFCGTRKPNTIHTFIFGRREVLCKASFREGNFWGWAYA